MARFATAQTSDGGAVNTLVDALNTAVLSTPATPSITTAYVLTTAQLINGVFQPTGTNAGVTLTLPSTAAIIAALPNAQVGTFFDFLIQNLTSNTLTITVGDASTTLVGTAAVPTNCGQFCRGYVTGTGATLDFCMLLKTAS